MKKLLKLFALIAASSCAAVTPAFAQSARQMTRSSLPGDSSLLVTSDTTATPGVFATRAISYAAFRSALGVTVRVTDTVRNVTFDSVRATNHIGPINTCCVFRFTGTTTGWGGNSSTLTAYIGGSASHNFSSSQFQTTSGTSTSPGVAINSDNNTGLSWLGSDTLAVINGGLRNVTLVNGKVMVDTTTGNIPYSFYGLGTMGFGRVGNTVNTYVSALPVMTVGSGAWTGGASSLTITAGTGNSRSISLQSTNSAGTTVPGFAFFGDSSLNLAASSITITPNGGGSNIPLLRGNAGLVLLGGAGNSRTVVIQTTNGSGTAQTNATFAADQTTTFNSTVQVGGSGQFRSPNGSAATPGHAFANATGSGMYVETTANPDTLGFTSQGSAFLKGISDTLVVWNEAKAPSLTAASGTPNTLCLDATSKLVLENAATSCVVSSRRFKTDIRPLSYSQASYITRNLQPSTFTYRQGGRKAIGLIAEQADSVDSRLATRDGQGRINSVNYEQVTVVLLRQVQELQARLDRMCKAGVTSAC